MAQSTVDCCNSALQKLGAASILSLTDNGREARQCSIAFDSNRRSELRKYRWNFAITRAVLAPDSVAPTFDYTYAFTLPSDCLRILLPRDADLDWVLEGRKILTNLGPVLNLRYIADITDTTLWDSAFYDMVAISMAIDMCEALTNSTSKKATLDREYEDCRNCARLNNSFEQMSAEAPDDTFWLARY
jgi:hypothetical protein